MACASASVGANGFWQIAATRAAALGVELITLPIADVVAAFETVLAGAFAGTERDVTEENLQ